MISFVNPQNLSIYQETSFPYNFSEKKCQPTFNPYAMNGGTIMAVAGEDFAVIAGDTRLSTGYSIYSRNISKTKPITSTCVLATTGFHGDAVTLHKQLNWRAKVYWQNHDKELSISAAAQLLSTLLYYKRFFPYYAYNILAGLDENGKGAVYSYDPVGSYEREDYRAGGTGASLLQPFLDSELGQKNKQNIEKKKFSLSEVLLLVKDAFSGCAERDIYTGDSVEIITITNFGIQQETFNLRRD
ncbi:proteasome subunit beta type-1-B-like [Zophobas morio]|uniref:proteasome subunit beta type-1-B-like n=1 Tax=Zophobas morio TaxID=2755281 RepID=UPI003083910B